MPQEGTMEEVDVDELLAELERRVDERRRAGQYPEGMERQLEAQFDAMLRAIRRTELDTSTLATLTDEVGRSAEHIGDAPDLESRLPGGSAVHALIGRAVSRHTEGVAASTRVFGDDVRRSLLETRRLIEAQRTADERQLLEVLAGVLDRLAVLDHLVEITRSLESRLADLERRIGPDE
jgi:hypothetical protein